MNEETPNHQSIEEEDAPSLAGRLLTAAAAIRPDDVTSAYSDKGVALTVKVLPVDEEDTEQLRPLVLIEGDRLSLLFLADLIIAQAGDPLDCGFQVHADMERFFAKTTQAGLYIHTLPCSHTDLKKAQEKKTGL